MALIVVVNPEGNDPSPLLGPLREEGWQVEVATEIDAATAADAAVLVLVGAAGVAAAAPHEVGGAARVALGELTRTPDGVDEVLAPPWTGEQLRAAVRRALATRQRAAAQAAAHEAADSGEQLTSAQLFGDLLAEVESDDEPEPAAGQPATPPAPASPPPPARPRPTTTGDLDRRLENTLSGLLEAPRQPRRAPERSASDDVDDLLNQTLSGLGVGATRRAPRAAPPAATPSASAKSESPSAAPSPSAPAPPAAAAPPGEASAAPPAIETQRSDELRETVAIPAPEPAAGAAEAADGQRAFGQYTLLELIAKGGMAEVWKARMRGVEGFQKNVAIKRILPHLTDQQRLRHHVHRRGQAGGAAEPSQHHPHLRPGQDRRRLLHRHGVRGGQGPPLACSPRCEKRGEAMPPALATLVAARLASALDHAHRRRDFDDRELGLVHRDVSPQNVLISYEGDIKLCDFGIAKAVAKASKTQMGALKGKLQYMSPEQAWGRTVDSRSDIFSLGAVLFEMLTGQRLFAGENEMTVLDAVRECRTRSCREVAPEVPERLDAIVARALAERPEDRYQSAGEMQRDLEEALYSFKPTPGPAELGAWVRDTTAAVDAPAGGAVAAAAGRAEAATGSEVPALAPAAPLGDEEEEPGRRWWWAAAAALLLIVAIAAALSLRQGGDEQPAPVEARSPAPEAMVSATSGEPAAPAAVATAAPESPATDAAGAPEAEDPAASDPAAGIDLESLVAQQLQEREEALRQQFEERRRQLEEEIAASRAAESGSGAAGEQETPVATAPTAGPAAVTAAGANPAAQAPETTAPAAARPPAAAETTPEADQAPATAASTPPPATTTPPTRPASPPATTPPAAEPAPRRAEPSRPAVGDLVVLGTPGLQSPKLVSIQKPSYPPLAKRLRVQGTVVVGVLVDENGRVSDTNLIQGVQQNVGINEAALAAARTARFEPATQDGVRVSTWFNLTIPFKL
jgi:TonB family protein